MSVRILIVEDYEPFQRFVSLPESEIIFLSMEYSIDVVQKALSLGALGYVEKLSSAAEILAAVEAVCQGTPYVSLSHLPRQGRT